MKRKVDIPSGLGDLLHLRLKTIPSTSREWISINISLSSIVTSRGNNSCLSWKFRVGWFEQVLKFFSAKQPPIWTPPPPQSYPIFIFHEINGVFPSSRYNFWMEIFILRSRATSYCTLDFWRHMFSSLFRFSLCSQLNILSISKFSAVGGRSLIFSKLLFYQFQVNSLNIPIYLSVSHKLFKHILCQLIQRIHHHWLLVPMFVGTIKKKRILTKEHSHKSETCKMNKQ